MRNVMRVGAIACAVVGIVPVASAGAALPTGGGKTIVPGVSIAGVKPGMTPEQVTALWGAPETIRGISYWKADPGPSLSTGHISVKFLGGKAAEIVLVSPYKSSIGRTQPFFTGPLLAYKTSKRIGIGSTKVAAAKAYPKARLVRGNLIFKGAGGTMQFLSVDARGGDPAAKRIYRIRLTAG